MGLSRSARMRRPEFRSASGRGGPRASVGPLSVHILGVRERPPVDGPVKVGFAVGRPVGGAVVRNKVRRRLREAAATALPVQARSGGGPPAGPALLLVRVRPGVQDLGVDDLTDLLSTAWARVSRAAGGRR